MKKIIDFGALVLEEAMLRWGKFSKSDSSYGPSDRWVVI